MARWRIVLLIAAGLLIGTAVLRHHLPGGGPADIYVLYESSRTSPAFADLMVDARRRDFEEQLRAHGHRLMFIDNDAVDERQRPLPLISEYGPFSDDKVEVIALSRQAGRRKLLGRRAASYDLTLDAFRQLLVSMGLL